MTFFNRGKVYRKMASHGLLRKNMNDEQKSLILARKYTRGEIGWWEFSESCLVLTRNKPLCFGDYRWFERCPHPATHHPCPLCKKISQFFIEEA